MLLKEYKYVVWVKISDFGVIDDDTPVMSIVFKMQTWCRENIKYWKNEDYYTLDTKIRFYFTNQKDASLFSLFWS